MFVETLFIIAKKKWKQCKISTREYSKNKKTIRGIFITSVTIQQEQKEWIDTSSNWMNLKWIVLSKETQTHTLLFYYSMKSRTGRTNLGTKNQNGDCLWG